MAESNRIPVFIVGGGPVGLALILALDRFGIRSLVVERSATTTVHPKSRGCWVRTMESFRQWGVEDAIRPRGLADGTDVFVMMERLTGREPPCPSTALMSGPRRPVSAARGPDRRDPINDGYALLRRRSRCRRSPSPPRGAPSPGLTPGFAVQTL